MLYTDSVLLPDADRKFQLLLVRALRRQGIDATLVILDNQHSRVFTWDKIMSMNPPIQPPLTREGVVNAIQSHPDQEQEKALVMCVELTTRRMHEIVFMKEYTREEVDALVPDLHVPGEGLDVRYSLDITAEQLQTAIQDVNALVVTHRRAAAARGV
jgi:hypothetical protein